RCFLAPNASPHTRSAQSRAKHSWLPPPLLERLPRITTSARLLFPQFDELARLPAPPMFRRPFAYNVLVLARLKHLTGNVCTKDHVAALATRRSVMVGQFVALGHALKKVLVTDAASPGKDFREFKRIIRRIQVIFRGSLSVRLSLLAHGLPLSSFLHRRSLCGSFFLRQRPHANVAHRADRAPGRHAERPAWLAFGAQRDLLVLGVEIHDLLVIDPGLDAVFRDADADLVPLVVLEIAEGVGVVVRGVAEIDAGEADDGAAPAADHERAVRVADRERRRAEEVVALDLLAFERDLVIHLGEVLAGEGDACHVVAAFHDDGALFDEGLALAAELGRFEAGERFAVEEGLPVLVLVGFLLGRFLVLLRQDGHRDRDSQYDPNSQDAQCLHRTPSADGP